jgi:c(7)-type cytochrome triheme protein
MRLFVAVVCLAVWTMLGFSALTAQEPSEKLVFKSKMGNITFLHQAHAKREKGDCKVCHDKLFQQSATAPLNYRAGIHKVAEAKKLSCGACHVAGGKSFESKGNCAKCHVKGS